MHTTYWTQTIDSTPWIFFRKQDSLFATTLNHRQHRPSRIRLDAQGTFTVDGGCPLHVLEAFFNPKEGSPAASISEYSEIGEEVESWLVCHHDGQFQAYSCWKDRAFSVHEGDADLEILWTSGEVTLAHISTVVHEYKTLAAD